MSVALEKGCGRWRGAGRWALNCGHAAEDVRDVMAFAEREITEIGLRFDWKYRMNWP